MASDQHLVYFSSREILNAVPANAALLSPDVEIKAVNASWIEFAEKNVGSNYLGVCEATQGSDRPFSLDIIRGIRELTQGLRTTLSVPYPCHSPSSQRWYLLNATRGVGAVSRWRAAAYSNRNRSYPHK